MLLDNMFCMLPQWGEKNMPKQTKITEYFGAEQVWEGLGRIYFSFLYYFHD